jgi:hypothetical protein
MIQLQKNKLWAHTAQHWEEVSWQAIKIQIKEIKRYK